MADTVAFLRGMNLGRRRIKNDELCDAFESMGFTDVSAFLASGNVMFSADAPAAALEATIAAGLEERLGYPVDTFVRTADEVVAIGARRPFSDDEMAATAGKVQVAMLAAEPSDESRRDALALATAEDRLALDARELYWLPTVGVSTSDLDLRGLEKALGSMPVRTQRTAERLAKKLGVSS